MPYPSAACPDGHSRPMVANAAPSGWARRIAGGRPGTSRSLATIAVGLLLGAVLSLAIGRALADVVRGVDTTDAVTLAGVALLLLLASLAAVLLPSRRAARVHPAESLAAE